ncbi:MAG TPA: GspH/FimT family pseudopilin [Methylomirabilota bacterium]|nr:GspH/FimT family pseudopilin [Methylomirabilota bacterium]
MGHEPGPALAAGAPARRAAGFTLLELLVTLAIVAVAAALVLPAIGRTTDTVRARAEVAGFSAVLRHARERAITSHTPHEVVIDLTAHRMAVTTAAPGAEPEVTRTRALSPVLRVEATPPPALTVRFEPQGSSSGGDFRLVSGAIAYRVTVDPLTGRVKSVRQ